MRKTVCAIILMVGICFTMTSCTNEKPSLNGTTWLGVEANRNYTLSFYECTFTLCESDNESDFYSGTYIFDDPIVILYHGEQVFLSGKVVGDSMIMGERLIFTKE